uniref:3D domain-containing protein n=1 Tax=Candidatus Enterococcus willemsii TaxID=1857215 RepID=UPI00403F1906
MKKFKFLALGSVAFLSMVGFSATANADEIEHTVAPSDTLSSISLQYFGNVSHVQQIADANNIANPNLIFDGTKLTINTDGEAAPTTEATPETSAVETPAASTETADNSANYSGRTITMESTAYSSDPADSLGGGTVTATGQNLLENPMAVAVDPNVIPLGTRLYVEGYGEAIASDTGGAIKGNIVDVHFPTYEQCIAWGRRSVQVTILD